MTPPRGELDWPQVLRLLALLGGIVFLCLIGTCGGAAIWSHFSQGG